MEPIFENIISVENLLSAWKEFVCGKRIRKDVLVFELNLMDNILDLHSDLKNKIYKHSGYEAFKINDPKPRDIHKATVRDRLLHHSIYRILYTYFDKKFIDDSYSCRINKGTHRAINRFQKFSRKVSKNYTKQAYVLKCDIRKFFASINQNILKNILDKHTKDKDILWLLNEVISSFHTEDKVNIGLPLGNLTSQLLVNIYMNEFDQYVKHSLKCKYYIRYADDFVVMADDLVYLKILKTKFALFLKSKLDLDLHPKKVFIKTVTSGVDFLGWINFATHRVLRTSTKRKMFRNIKLKTEDKKGNVVASYFGMLGWGNGWKLQEEIKK